MLRNRQRIACHAADDNHDVYPIGHPANDSFGGFAMIMPEAFTYSSVIDAMEKGEMYASRGPGSCGSRSSMRKSGQPIPADISATSFRSESDR